LFLFLVLLWDIDLFITRGGSPPGPDTGSHLHPPPIEVTSPSFYSISTTTSYRLELGEFLPQPPCPPPRGTGQAPDKAPPSLAGSQPKEEEEEEQCPSRGSRGRRGVGSCTPWKTLAGKTRLPRTVSLQLRVCVRVPREQQAGFQMITSSAS